jgi:hypothetical protein
MGILIQPSQDIHGDLQGFFDLEQASFAVDARGPMGAMQGFEDANDGVERVAVRRVFCHRVILLDCYDVVHPGQAVGGDQQYDPEDGQRSQMDRRRPERVVSECFSQR